MNSGEPIQNPCITCGKLYPFREDLAGKKVRCKQCGSVLRMPVSPTEPFDLLEVGDQVFGGASPTDARPPIASSGGFGGDAAEGSTLGSSQAEDHRLDDDEIRIREDDFIEPAAETEFELNLDPHSNPDIHPEIDRDSESASTSSMHADVHGGQMSTPATPATPATPPPLNPNAGGGVGIGESDDDPYALNLDDDLAATSSPAPAPLPSAMAREAGATSAPAKCPSCNMKLKPGQVVCLNCGYDVRAGKKLDIQVDTGPPVQDGADVSDAAAVAPAGEMPRGAQPSVHLNLSDQLGDAADGPKTTFVDWILPAIMIVVGFALSIAEQSVLSENATSVGMAAIVTTVGTVLTVPLLLGGLFLCAAILEINFGSLGVGLFKVTAITIGPGALASFLSTAIAGDFGFWFIGMPMMFMFFWISLSVLFGLDAQDSLWVVMLLLFFRWIAMWIAMFVALTFMM